MFYKYQEIRNNSKTLYSHWYNKQPHIDYPDLQSEIGFRVSCKKHKDVFITPKCNTLFSRALAYKISTELDFFVLFRNIFRFKALK